MENETEAGIASQLVGFRARQAKAKFQPGNILWFLIKTVVDK